MIAPDFSGKRVQSGRHPYDKTVDHSLRLSEKKQPPRSPEKKRHDKTRQIGHILIERHGNEKRSHGEKSPHSRRREINQNFQGQIEPSPTKQHHVELARELHNVSKNLGLCYEELKSGYMREIMIEIERNDTVNSVHLLAIKDLFQQLMKEMVHLQRVLSQHNDTSFSHDDMHEKPLNNPVSDVLNPNDLVHLKGPLTENTIITTLQARFNKSLYHTKIGPVHLIVNPFNSSEAKYDKHKESNNSLYMRSLIRNSLEQLLETQTPQMLILSGESGSGKSFTAQRLIKELMHFSCGTAQTDLVKHVDASVTVLDSIVKAKTMNNAESSRVAILYEFHFNNQVIHKTKIKYIPLNMSRIVHGRENETNFRIFYQLFAGLSPKDRAKLQLQTHSAHELQYLYHYPSENQAEIEILRNQFHTWKSALQILGIPFADVTKVLAAVLLLGNVHFTEKSPRVLEVQGGDFELKAVAVLLGVSYTSLFRGLTKKTKLIKSDTTLQCCSDTQANRNRDALAKTLYSRMLSAIVRRCNCSRKSTLSAENRQSPASSSESLIRSHDRFAEKKSQVSDNNLDANDHNVLGIADLFGFDNCNCNGMEQICTNLCSETIQHFYTTHIFKSTEGFCREEGIQNEVDVDYMDNSQCIELLTCQETGVLTHLDHETSKNGSTEDFVEKLRTKHAGHQKFSTTNCGSCEFGIAHHSGQVIYDADVLLRGNDDSVADDVIQMFSSEQCSFGFVVHLFASDRKPIPEKDRNEVKEAEALDSVNSSSIRTFSQEFQDKLDELLKTLIHADPWFILCLKSNNQGLPCHFDSEIISKQVKALQIFETVHLSRSGYTHRMRLIPFAQRYFVQDDELSLNEAQEIAQSYQKMINEGNGKIPGKILYIGRKHVFFSEMLWQDLERSRPKRYLSHSFDTGHVASSLEHANSKEDTVSISPQNELLQTNTRAKNELNIPPAIPKRRGYTVIDNKKIAFPQVRVMIDDYTDTINGRDVVFTCGESVNVTGASPKAGYLAVEGRQKTGWVPYKLTRLMTDDVM